jgi:hypothetical protein
MKIIDRFGKLTNINFNSIQGKKSLQKYTNRKTCWLEFVTFYKSSLLKILKSNLTSCLRYLLLYKLLFNANILKKIVTYIKLLSFSSSDIPFAKLECWEICLYTHGIQLKMLQR